MLSPSTTATPTISSEPVKNDSAQCHSTHDVWPVGGSLTVLHAAWHPLSCDHLVVLQKGNMISIFNVSKSLEIPEQKFELQTHSEQLVSFTFPDIAPLSEKGWEQLTIYTLARSGAVRSIICLFRFVLSCSF